MLRSIALKLARAERTASGSSVVAQRTAFGLAGGRNSRRDSSRSSDRQDRQSRQNRQNRQNRQDPSTGQFRMPQLDFGSRNRHKESRESSGPSWRGGSPLAGDFNPVNEASARRELPYQSLSPAERTARREFLRFKEAVHAPPHTPKEKNLPVPASDEDQLTADSHRGTPEDAEQTFDAREMTIHARSGLKAAGDLDSFFTGLELEEDLDVDLDLSKPPPATSENEFYSYTAPTESGVAKVKKLMVEHKFLTCKQIWDFETSHLKPPLRPAHLIEPDGKIKMKRVSTMREGRRPWVPPITASFPDHPFRSVRFLKETIMASLEDAGVVHKIRLFRPLETEEEHKEAIKKAESLHRSAERKAARLGLPPPLPRAPATMVPIWGFLLGPQHLAGSPAEIREAKLKYENACKWALLRAADEGKSPQEAEMPDLKTFMPKRKQPAPGIQYGWPQSPTLEEARAANYEVDDAKWDKAQDAELRYHQAKLREAQAIVARQVIRRRRNKTLREQEQEQMRKDIEEGFDVVAQNESRRDEALERILDYARLTGQDVSAWVEELSKGQVGESPEYVPRHSHHGGAIPRARKNPRSSMRPLGFPIN